VGPTLGLEDIMDTFLTLISKKYTFQRGGDTRG